MKKILGLIIVVIFLVAIVGIAIADDFGNKGPAPNSGDGISDGSGFVSPNGPSGEGTTGPVGPAPNAGDGIPDGSGIDAPSGPNK